MGARLSVKLKLPALSARCLGLDLSEQVFQDEQSNSVIRTGTELQLKEFVSIALFPDLDSQTQPISITSSMLFKVLFQTRNPVHVLSRRALGRKR